MSSANAIFGLSACEKASKAIVNEEKIGYESWKYYRELVKNHNRDPKWNMSLADALAEVYKSDKAVYLIAQKNNKCYSPSQNAFIRRQNSDTTKALDQYRSSLKNDNFQYQTYDWTVFYKQYFSLKAMLNKLNKQ